MKFDKECLIEVVSCPVGRAYPANEFGPDFQLLSNELVRESRWANWYEAVFRSGGKCYLLEYDRGKTEMQESETFDYSDPSDIECPEVRCWEETVTKIVVKYELVKEGS
jgi:hypothetical protein